MKYIQKLIKKIQTESLKGFTLIEALVSLGLFSIVVVSASGVILSVISSNKRNQAISSVVNNLNYSIESMVRDIKTGYRYHCIPDASNYDDFVIEAFKLKTETCQAGVPINSITLISTITGKEQVVRYELYGTGEDAYIKKTLYSQDENDVVTAVQYPLTDEKNIYVKKLEFTVHTPNALIPFPTDGVVAQPSVFLLVSGTAKINQINISDFFIQTFISQRLPNFI